MEIIPKITHWDGYIYGVKPVNLILVIGGGGIIG